MLSTPLLHLLGSLELGGGAVRVSIKRLRQNSLVIFGRCLLVKGFRHEESLLVYLILREPSVLEPALPSALHQGRRQLRVQDVLYLLALKLIEGEADAEGASAVPVFGLFGHFLLVRIL